MLAKSLLVGFLSGILSIISFVLTVYLALSLFELFFVGLPAMIEADVAGSAPLGDTPWRLMIDSLLVSLSNAFHGLIQAIPGLILGGVLGSIAGAGYRVGVLLYRKRAWRVSFALAAAALAVPTVTWAIVQREQVALWILDNPEMYGWRDLLLESYATELLVTLAFALAGAYVVWAVWRWWYVRLVDWLLSEGLHTITESKLDSDPILRSKKLVAWMGVSFLVCGALLVPAKWFHDRVALRLQHGVVWLDSEARPEETFEVAIRPEARKIRVVNTEGLGTVSVQLSQAGDPESVVVSIEDWSFKWRLDEYLYRDLRVDGVEPGAYQLHFVQEAGWGYFEYALGDGGGPASHTAALVLGVLLAFTLVLGLGLIGVLALRMSRRPTG